MHTPTITLDAEIAEAIAARLRVDLESAATEAEAQHLRADRSAIACSDARKDLATLEESPCGKSFAELESSLRTLRGAITRHSNAAADARRAAADALDNFRALGEFCEALTSAIRAAKR